MEGFKWWEDVILCSWWCRLRNRAQDGSRNVCGASEGAVSIIDKPRASRELLTGYWSSDKVIDVVVRWIFISCGWISDFSVINIYWLLRAYLLLS